MARHSLPIRPDHRWVLLTALTGSLLSAPVALTQSTGNPAGAQATLPEYTDAQRWSRAALFAIDVAGIRLAKDRGEDAVSYAQMLVGIFAPESWGLPNRYNREPFSYARSLHRNGMVHPGMRYEILSATKDEVRARRSRPYATSFGSALVSHGVTLDEYEAMLETIDRLIGAYVGVDYSQSASGEWVVFSVKSRPAPATPFPAGVYEATVTGAGARLDGVWRITLDGDRYSATLNGELVEQDRYTVAGDLITLALPTGPRACARGATYRWRADGDALSFERVAELCRGRATSLGRTFKKVTSPGS